MCRIKLVFLHLVNLCLIRVNLANSPVMNNLAKIGGYKTGLMLVDMPSVSCFKQPLVSSSSQMLHISKQILGIMEVFHFHVSQV